MYSGSEERINGYTVLGVADVGLVYISEIACFPIGLALYINKPDAFNPQGIDITEFATYEYDREYELTICMPILECNSSFPMDYRTKENIMCCIEESKQWIENNMDKDIP